MQLTTENQRSRWIGLFVIWGLVAALLIVHALILRDYMGLLQNLGLRGAPAATTPFQRICPTMYADTQMWVRHSLALADGAGPQLRYTYVDNAPFGREVHWDSAFAWLIVGAGWLRHAMFGETLSLGTEQALAWFNPPLLLAFVVFFSVWVARRLGLGAAALIAFGMVGNPDFYSGFAPYYVDHHGVLAAAVFGVMLGALFMGIGFVRPNGTETQLLPGSAETARTGAVLSAVSGAVGMWVSAATLIPAIAIVGLSGAFVTLLFGRGVRGERTIDPGIWRLWGSLGGILCLALYLLEYAPHHLGLRLEVNHPVYALGWWGGAEIIAQLATWRAGAPRPFRPLALVAAIVAVSVAPLTILIGGEKVFVVFDPFVARLSAHVAEGISLVKAVKIFGWARVYVEAPWLLLTFVLGGIAVWKSDRADRPLVVFSLVALAGFLVMAFAQIRWWPSASGPVICVILLGISVVAAGRSARARWLLVLAPIVVLFLPTAVIRITSNRDSVKARAVDSADAMQPVYRDIAAVLRASQPQGDIVLLASPNASVAISYYGAFKSIGTLYWENLDGTKAAAEMFGAATEIEARQALRQRRVTHVAMVSQDNFLAEYFDLMHPGASREALNKSFGCQLLVDQNVPIWLEQIPYEVPGDVPLKPDRVLLFRVHLDNPAAAEAAYSMALAAIDRGDLRVAEQNLNEALKIAPHTAEYALIKAHLLLARKDNNGALAATIDAADNVSAEKRVGLYMSEAKRFYREHAHKAAADLYRRTLAIQFQPEAANNLVWLLATSSDDTLRNGPEALAVAERIVPEHQGYTFISAYAAALAECGRFADAVKVGERALELARASNNDAFTSNAENRLNAYRAGKPWRE